jgi:hypothetical protein
MWALGTAEKRRLWLIRSGRRRIMIGLSPMEKFRVSQIAGPDPDRPNFRFGGDTDATEDSCGLVIETSRNCDHSLSLV